MTYELEFHESALKEWESLDNNVRQRLRKKLKRRLSDPRVPSSELRGELAGCYKIKDEVSGYRLIYEIIDHEVVVIVLSVGKRDKLLAYLAATLRRR